MANSSVFVHAWFLITHMLFFSFADVSDWLANIELFAIQAIKSIDYFWLHIFLSSVLMVKMASFGIVSFKH